MQAQNTCATPLMSCTALPAISTAPVPCTSPPVRECRQACLAQVQACQIQLGPRHSVDVPCSPQLLVHEGLSKLKATGAMHTRPRGWVTQHSCMRLIISFSRPIPALSLVIGHSSALYTQPTYTSCVTQQSGRQMDTLLFGACNHNGTGKSMWNQSKLAAASLFCEQSDCRTSMHVSSMYMVRSPGISI